MQTLFSLNPVAATNNDLSLCSISLILCNLLFILLIVFVSTSRVVTGSTSDSLNSRYGVRDQFTISFFVNT